MASLCFFLGFMFHAISLNTHSEPSGLYSCVWIVREKDYLFGFSANMHVFAQREPTDGLKAGRRSVTSTAVRAVWMAEPTPHKKVTLPKKTNNIAATRTPTHVSGGATKWQKRQTSPLRRQWRKAHIEGEGDRQTRVTAHAAAAAATVV